MKLITIKEAIKKALEIDYNDIFIVDMYDEVYVDSIQFEYDEQTKDIKLRLPYTTNGGHGWDKEIAKELYE